MIGYSETLDHTRHVKIKTKRLCSFQNGTFLLGDAAYPCIDWLVTPFKDDENRSQDQKRFTSKHHSPTRVHIGRLLVYWRVASEILIWYILVVDIFFDREYDINDIHVLPLSSCIPAPLLFSLSHVVLKAEQKVFEYIFTLFSATNNFHLF